MLFLTCLMVSAAISLCIWTTLHIIAMWAFADEEENDGR
jgi:hypothetical protein